MSFKCQNSQRLTFVNVLQRRRQAVRPAGGGGVAKVEGDYLKAMPKQQKHNCDLSRLIILYLSAVFAVIAILPNNNVECAKLENTQMRLLINDDDLLLQEKSAIHYDPALDSMGSSNAETETASFSHSGEHFNLYRSELKRLSYETIHRILRDENEPSYRREETELRYYQKRSPQPLEVTHQLTKRSSDQQSTANLTQQHLKELPMSLLKSNVQVLDVSHNFLSGTINISAFKNLEILLANNNLLQEIPLTTAQQMALKTINLNNNEIKSTSQYDATANNSQLQQLYLSNNIIDNVNSLALTSLRNLELLDLSCNHLKSMDSSLFTERMHNMKHLNLAYNQLNSIYRETFYNLLSLNTLLLSHNNISDIDYETFLALPNLQYLDLSFNNLRGKSIRALQGITGLIALDIAFNPSLGPYMQEFVASWSLKELDASGTGLCQIPAALAQSVRTLKLSYNWLKLINCGDLDSYPLLQYLDLSHSHIEDIEDDALGRLEILEILMIDNNKLKKIPLSLPVSLEYLFLQNNQIMDIQQQAFQGLLNLKTLDLSANNLMYLPALPLGKLQTLNLQNSGIKGISQQIVHTLPRLTDLMLENNPIKCSDLLGIAEWASTCRQRPAKEEESEGIKAASITLKERFERMHDFYEEFGGNNCERTIKRSEEQQAREEQKVFREMPLCAQEIAESVQTMTVATMAETVVGTAIKALSETKINSKLNVNIMQNKNKKFENFKTKTENLEFSVGNLEKRKVNEDDDDDDGAAAANMKAANDKEVATKISTAEATKHSSIHVENLTAINATTNTQQNPAAAAATTATAIVIATPEIAQMENEKKRLVGNSLGTAKEMKIFDETIQNATTARTTAGTTATGSISSTVLKFKEEQSKIILANSLLNANIHETENAEKRGKASSPEATASSSSSSLPSSTIKTANKDLAQKLDDSNTDGQGKASGEIEQISTAQTINLFKQKTTTAATTTTTAETTIMEATATAVPPLKPQNINLEREKIASTTLGKTAIKPNHKTAIPTAAATQEPPATAKTTEAAAAADTLWQITLATLNDNNLNKDHKELNNSNSLPTSNLIMKKNSISSTSSRPSDSMKPMLETRTEAAAAATTTKTITELRSTVARTKLNEEESTKKIATSIEHSAAALQLPTAISSTTNLNIKQQTLKDKMAAPAASNYNNSDSLNKHKSNQKVDTLNPIRTATTIRSTATTQHTDEEEEEETAIERVPLIISQTTASAVINMDMDDINAAETKSKVLFQEHHQSDGQQRAIKENMKSEEEIVMATTTLRGAAEAGEVETGNRETKVKQVKEDSGTITSEIGEALYIGGLKTDTMSQHELPHTAAIKSTTAASITSKRATDIADKDKITNADQLDTTMSSSSSVNASSALPPPTSSSSSSSSSSSAAAAASSFSSSTTAKHVNVKCPIMANNSNECISGTPQTNHRHGDDADDDLNTKPVKKTKDHESSNENVGNKPANSANSQAFDKSHNATTTTTKTAIVVTTLHKHEPLQLHVKDRHLIGTPLLMHKGENLLVTADELILGKTNAKQAEMPRDIESASSSSAEQLHKDTKEILYEKNQLDKSQSTSFTMALATEPTPRTTSSSMQYLSKAMTTTTATATATTNSLSLPGLSTDNAKSIIDNNAGDQVNVNHIDDDDYGSKNIKKLNADLRYKKPSLIMKKMTIITSNKQQQQQMQHKMEQHSPHDLTAEEASLIHEDQEPKMHQTHHQLSHIGDKHYQELKPLKRDINVKKEEQHSKHVSINTPNVHQKKLLTMLHHDGGHHIDPHLFESEHELLMKQIEREQLPHEHEKLSKTEPWSDLRKTESRENHPGLVLLVSSGLFVVLLLGLMHVYRCDMPWRRSGNAAHHLRPHQMRSSGSGGGDLLEDDAHSFLSYNEGIQKWHHKVRLEAPYSSPLHHLHVKDLKTTSATEKPATFKTTASSSCSSSGYKPRLQHSSSLLTSSNSNNIITAGGLGALFADSQSSTTNTTRTTSPSSSAILDDDSFYIEMSPDSGQIRCSLQSELLPMELLNIQTNSNAVQEGSSSGDKESLNAIFDHHLTMSSVDDLEENQNNNHQNLLSATIASTSATNSTPFRSSLSTVNAAGGGSAGRVSHANSRKFGLW